MTNDQLELLNRKLDELLDAKLGRISVSGNTLRIKNKSITFNNQQTPTVSFSKTVTSR